MGIIITRPIAIDGLQSTGALPFIMGDIVDARLIMDNFAAVYEAINGGLHGNNIKWPHLDSDKMTDELVKFPEYVSAYGEAHSVPGQVHSHDGEDSARLGIGAVSMNATQYRSFGAWMFQSFRARQVIIHGSAKIESMKSAPAVLSYSLDLPVSAEFSDIPSLINTRGFASLRTSDPDVEKANIDNVFLCVSTYVEDGETIPFLLAKLYCPIAITAAVLNDTYIDWFLVYYPLGGA